MYLSKKPILIATLIFLQLKCFAQLKNYRVENERVHCQKAQSDISILQISEEQTVLKNDKNQENNYSLSSELTSFLIGKVAKIPDYITQYLQKRKLKFTSTYEAKNTLSFASSKEFLPKLTFKRYFFTKSNIKEKAVHLVLCPKLVQNEKYLVFNIESLEYKYSKAKLKKKAFRINLLVEITLYYTKTINKINTIEKTESKSSAIIIPASLNTETQNIDIISSKLSDTFIADDISEIQVKITEINPHKLKLEELESFLTTNKEDLSGLFKELSKLLE